MNLDEAKFIVACALGATVRVLRNDGATIKRKATEVFSGMAVAYYFGAGAVSHWGIEPAAAVSLGFVIGLVGMELSGTVMTVVDSYLPMILRDVLRRRLGVDATPSPPAADGEKPQ